MVPESHYEYLDLVLDKFWMKVFGKTLSQAWCGGIVDAHGDKGYGYKSEWANQGISFNRGMAIFMLTRTKLKDDSSISTKEWVIREYPKYLPILQEIETELNIEGA